MESSDHTPAPRKPESIVTGTDFRCSILAREVICTRGSYELLQKPQQCCGARWDEMEREVRLFDGIHVF